MYLFCNSRIHVITLYSSHVCVYYVSMLQCWHLVWILVMTNHPCLGVGCHSGEALQNSLGVGGAYETGVFKRLAHVCNSGLQL
jgi:hypothetical protein